MPISIGYFILLIGALAALGYGGVLKHVSAMWVVIGLVIAVGLGIMLSVSAGKPEITANSADTCEGAKPVVVSGKTVAGFLFCLYACGDAWKRWQAAGSAEACEAAA